MGTSVENENAGSDAIDRAVAVWKKAQVVYQSPSWEGKPEPRALAERIASKHRDCEDKLLPLLADDNQLVVAYALLTLQLMGSQSLGSLPAAVLKRQSKITLKTGSFSISTDVGGFARQLQKGAVRNKPADGAAKTTE